MNRPTERETAAAQKLAQAFLDFLVEYEQGRAIRATSGTTPTSRDPLSVILQAHRPNSQSSSAPGSGTQSPPQQNLDENRLLTVREAAKLFLISDRTLWSLTRPRGPIPALHFGRTVRYAMDDLRAFIKSAKH